MFFVFLSYELRHAKRSPMAWVALIPKEGSTGNTFILLLVWHRLCNFFFFFWKVGVIPKEGRARPHAPILLLVWQRLRTLGTFLHDEAHVFFCILVIWGKQMNKLNTSLYYNSLEMIDDQIHTISAMRLSYQMRHVTLIQISHDSLAVDSLNLKAFFLFFLSAHHR